MTQRPTAIGLFLCEQVIVEERPRNVTPVNCFTERGAWAFPAEGIRFIAFALLTEGLGEITLELVVHRLDNFEELYRKAFSAEFANPLQTFRCLVRVRNCPFPRPGDYQVSLLAEDEIIAQRKLRIVALENPS
ncbi:MAG TPA: hypothetical protein VFA26_07015 [Gemmataceae bacterium]|nr:hypothetical protein [Gemmataceae bacterium]